MLIVTKIETSVKETLPFCRFFLYFFYFTVFHVDYYFVKVLKWEREECSDLKCFYLKLKQKIEKNFTFLLTKKKCRSMIDTY